jgi:hypothetical protein
MFFLTYFYPSSQCLNSQSKYFYNISFFLSGIGKVMADAVLANLNITPVITAVTELDTCK